MMESQFTTKASQFSMIDSWYNRLDTTFSLKGSQYTEGQFTELELVYHYDKGLVLYLTRMGI